MKITHQHYYKLTHPPFYRCADCGQIIFIKWVMGIPRFRIFERTPAGKRGQAKGKAAK